VLVFLPAAVVNGVLSRVTEQRVIDGRLTVLSVNMFQVCCLYFVHSFVFYKHVYTEKKGYQFGGGDGYEGHHNVARLYDVISRENPDIVALQGR
jgi:hypothetical protein